MPRTIKQRVKRFIFYRLARAVYLTRLAYIDLYLTDDEPEAGSGDDKQRIDLTGIVTGLFEVAVNREHRVSEIIGERRFGFGPPGRRDHGVARRPPG